MSRFSLRHALILSTAAVLLAFSATLLPAFSLSPYPMMVMLGFMAVMVVLQCRYALRVKPQPEPEPEPIKAPERPVILILGPYAAKWFSQANQNDNARYSGQAAWLLVSEPKELTRRLSYISKHAPGTQIMAFFPFLPDGHETSELIVENLMRWRSHFSGMVEYLTLPCAFAIYARLSNERRSNTPQNASWIGELDLTQQQAVSYADAMQDLKVRLKDDMLPGASHTQRAVMGVHLLQWLQESGIEAALNTLFTQAPLQLSNVVLCDYGNGFHRHGAWSSWLEEKYAILPGLGSTLTLPPFPKVAMPPALPVIAPRPVPATPTLPTFYWSIGLVIILLGAHVLNTTLQVRQQQVQFHQQMLRFATLQGLSLQKLQRYITDMEHVERQWDSCSTDSALQSWGLSPCKTFAARVENRVDALKSLPAISTAGGQALFDSGSAVLRSDADPLLKGIEALANAWPKQQLLIVGHSDNTGNETRNLWLSEQRAIAVRDWLIKQQISSDRLDIRAVGATEPVASNDTVEGRKKNRRVEVLVLPANNNDKEFMPK
ncbi:hypothetical protein CIG19_16920 [Enterobacterales bacterium CwR94]|nr:hypothetical protein CIG19_16920 [Enterobacterales bacterium CwR94]